MAWPIGPRPIRVTGVGCSSFSSGCGGGCWGTDALDDAREAVGAVAGVDLAADQRLDRVDDVGREAGLLARPDEVGEVGEREALLAGAGVVAPVDDVRV